MKFEILISLNLQLIQVTNLNMSINTLVRGLRTPVSLKMTETDIVVFVCRTRLLSVCVLDLFNCLILFLWRNWFGNFVNIHVIPTLRSLKMILHCKMTAKFTKVCYKDKMVTQCPYRCSSFVILHLVHYMTLCMSETGMVFRKAQQTYLTL